MTAHSVAGRRTVSAPFFEIGPKNLLRLSEIVEVGRAAADAGRRDGVTVILTVPSPVIPLVRAQVDDVLVFAQDMDDDRPGPSVGRVIAESLVDAGADGVMLNHDAHPKSPAELAEAVGRAGALGLATMVCAGSDDEAVAAARLAPTIVLYEPPSLIGVDGGADRPWIPAIDARVRDVASQVLMMHAGGVTTPDDVFAIMRAGAAGTGSTSGVLRDASPTRAAAAFIAAVRAGFDARRPIDLVR